MFINILKPDNSRKQSTLLLTNPKGFVQNISSDAAIKLNLSSSIILERRINLKTIIPELFVSHEYRDKGKLERFMPLIPVEGQDNKIDALVSINPLLFSSPPQDTETNPNILRENETLAGFAVTFEFTQQFVHPRINNNRSMSGDFDRRNRIKSERPSDNKLINNLYFYVRPEFFLQKPAAETKAAKSNKNNEQEKTSAKEISSEMHIITQRLSKGKIIDLYEREITIDDKGQNNLIAFEDAQLSDSIFKDNILKFEENRRVENHFARKNLLDTIIHKEKNSFILRMLKIFSFVWLLSAIGLNALFLATNTETNTKFQEKLTMLSKGFTIATSIGFFANKIYEIELTAASIMRANNSSDIRDAAILDLLIEANVIAKNITSEMNKFIGSIDDKVSNNTYLFSYPEDSGATNKIGNFVWKHDNLSNQTLIDSNYTNVPSYNNTTPARRLLFEMEEVKLEQSFRNLEDQQVNFLNAENNFSHNTTYMNVSANDTYSIFYNDVDPLQFVEITNYLTFDAGLNQMASLISGLIENFQTSKSLPFEDLAILTRQIYIRNLFEGIYMLNNGYINLKNELSKRFSIDAMTLEILSIGFFCNLLFFSFFIFTLRKVREKTARNLLLFLDITRKEVENLLRRAERFWQFCNVY